MKLLTIAVLLLALSGFAVPQRRETEDVPGQMVRARQALLTAKKEMASAGTEWGGHRVEAMKHVDQALEEIQKAEQWARAHKEIR
ncbi:MAG TPA: hypothetical protein VJP04_07540 [Terriglobales bacterium]|nr:hypothetical protein [Terriglobales bacterium]